MREMLRSVLGLRRKEGSPGGDKQEFVVIGLGRFGGSVAEELVRAGYEVLAIDRDPTRVQHLSTVLPHVVALDATKVEALREVGVEKFDTGLVSIGMDFEANLLATVLLLKEGVSRVIVKGRTRTQKEILGQVGAHEVILPEHEAGRRLARRLAHENVVDFLEVSPDVDVVEIVAPDHVTGMSLAESDLRAQFGLTVIAVRRGEETVVSPAADYRILDGDVLVVIGSVEDAQRLEV